jgi:flagellar biosynthetic protein FlhB
MAESSSQDRNLPASERKLAKAREEGNLPRSQDLGHFAALIVAVAGLVTLGPQLLFWMKDILSDGLRFDARFLREPDAMGQQLLLMTERLLWVILPTGAVMMLVAVGANLAVGGWNFSVAALKLRFDFLDPIGGLGRVFNKKSLITALKACLLAILLGLVGGLYLKNHLADFNNAWSMDLNAGISFVSKLMLSGLLLLLLLVALFAAIDAPLQKYLHASRLKMSQQEAKQEHKEVEGNAEVKGKVKARMREMASRRMLAAVPKADLVVMNPTHYAVALKYDEGSMAAPRVVAKGADLLAMTIRDVAKTSKVPVLQAPVLARALYAHAELDREIPAALFAAVAQVLAYVYQLRAAMAGRVAIPPEMPTLAVPPELDPHHGRTDTDRQEP